MVTVVTENEQSFVRYEIPGDEAEHVLHIKAMITAIASVKDKHDRQILMDMLHNMQPTQFQLHLKKCDGKTQQ
jgi:hypothetical protein